MGDEVRICGKIVYKNARLVSEIINFRNTNSLSVVEIDIRKNLLSQFLGVIGIKQWIECFFFFFIGLSIICIYSNDRKVYFKPAIIVWIKLF